MNQEIQDLIDKLKSEAMDYGAAQATDVEPGYLTLCVNTMDIAERKLIEAINLLMESK